MAINWNDKALVTQVKQAAMIGVLAGTEMVAEEARRLIMRTRKSGRLYVRRGVKHRASAAGQAPASDTGRLVGSIKTKYQPRELAGTVTASAKYAPFLEYGTRKMQPRPFMRPALANKSKQVTAVIQREIAKVLK